MTELLSVEHLTKSFGRRGLLRRNDLVPAVNDVSFTLARGETLGLVGESGAGKSTVGMLALRLVDPDSGHIRFDGTDVNALGSRELRRWRRRAQMVFQDPFGSFDPRMTIGQALLEPLRLHGIGDRASRRTTIDELLTTVGLDGRVLDRYPYEFSGGQLQRLAVARAIVCEPDLVVCDEPVAALDMSIQAQVLNLLHELQERRGFSMLFISHDLSLVRVVAHRTAVMYQGRIVEMGPTADIYENPMHPYTQALLSAIPLPDPSTQRHRPRVDLPLVPPSTVGCAFAPRCPHAMQICRTSRPELESVAGASGVTSCHLFSGSAEATVVESSAATAGRS